MNRMKVGVLISGRGSNLQALIDACAESNFPAQIVLVLSNKPNAVGLDRARDAGIDTAVVEHDAFPDRKSFDRLIDARLRDAGVELVCLAGFMRILTSGFVGRWQGRMLNIHPSLLPKFRGLHTHARALEAGDAEHGCTVHEVTPELDDGPILGQARVPVLPGDTPDSLAARVLVEEHKLYPAVLRRFASGDRSPIYLP